MSTLELVKNKLADGEPIDAVQYVRLEHFSEKRRDKIVANHGTKRCKNFLAEHPNIKLVEEPYVDCNFTRRTPSDRKGLMQMFMRLSDGDVKLVLVDDINELVSSSENAISILYFFSEMLDVVLLDMKNGVLFT